MRARTTVRSSLSVSTKNGSEHYRSIVAGRLPELLRYDGRHRRVESGLAEPVIVPNGLPRSADHFVEFRFLPALRTESGNAFEKVPARSHHPHPGGVTKG